MQLKMKDGTVWFDTMPTTDDAEHLFPAIHVMVEPEELMPEGEYTLEVRVKDSDGKEQTATANFKVSHAC